MSRVLLIAVLLVLAMLFLSGCGALAAVLPTTSTISMISAGPPAEFGTVACSARWDPGHTMVAEVAEVPPVARIGEQLGAASDINTTLAYRDTKGLDTSPLWRATARSTAPTAVVSGADTRTLTTQSINGTTLATTAFGRDGTNRHHTSLGAQLTNCSAISVTGTTATTTSTAWAATGEIGIQITLINEKKGFGTNSAMTSMGSNILRTSGTTTPTWMSMTTGDAALAATGSTWRTANTATIAGDANLLARTNQDTPAWRRADDATTGLVLATF